MWKEERRTKQKGRMCDDDTMTVDEMKATLERMQSMVFHLRTQVREMDRYLLSTHLGWEGDSDLWSWDMKDDINTQCSKKQNLREFLVEFGYERRGGSNRYRYLGDHQNDYPDIVLRDGMDIFEELPTEVINYIYLHKVYLHRRKIVHRAQMSRMLKRSREEECDEVTSKVARVSEAEE